MAVFEAANTVAVVAFVKEPLGMMSAIDIVEEIEVLLDVVYPSVAVAASVWDKERVCVGGFDDDVDKVEESVEGVD